MNEIAVLLKEYRAGNVPAKVERLAFVGAGDKDVYNITAPFVVDGKEVIAGRIESRDSEMAEIGFFEKQDLAWIRLANMPKLALQDPFMTRIDGDLIIGGVEVFPSEADPEKLAWRTCLYRGKGIADLTLFFEGPVGMKDLRLKQLPSGEIVVLTRPQGEKGGRGKIGFCLIEKLADLTVALIEDAPLLEPHFAEDEWGGANEMHLLKNGKLGVLSHIANFDAAGDRHYYAAICVIDPKTGAIEAPMEIIAERADFLAGPTKRPDLEDVVFSGGLIRNASGTADLYVGISDADAQKRTIRDPFVKFEG
ncbi:DUF1861 family protein [Listeria sp. SHR_NRA_18]|uniref:DUF1861 family protein n=1 Tax=Listeria TaxID=1637 RepID=UPI00051DBC34|nr:MULTISPECIES: DUF1861 family protein [Listeria]KGL44931.1 hypothetical protein EP56_05070 [Listeriaceae bacterium FSL A5-0209]KMT61891.1 hypothetical protein X559_1751 [Listeria newyorkensis]RQW68362.1 DUF1861 family protein [Listeria sp. SHR_NRA_18]